MSKCDDYDLVELLGEGSFGSVHRAVHRPSARTVAVKIISGVTAKDREDVQREVAIMANLSACPCAVRCYDSFENPLNGDFWIAMELCEAGSLMDLMFRVGCGFPEPAVALVLRSVLKALAFLHARRLVHRDIKAGNVLLTSEGDVRLADFGISKALGDSGLRVTQIGSPYWMAPEIAAERGYDQKVDIYALGVTAIELVDGCPPLARHSDAQDRRDLLEMVRAAPTPAFDCPADVSPELRSFVALCVQHDPARRPSAAALLRHAFLKRYSKTVQREGLRRYLSLSPTPPKSPLRASSTSSGPATLSSLLEPASDTGTVLICRAPRPTPPVAEQEPRDDDAPRAVPMDETLSALAAQLAQTYPAFARRLDGLRRRGARVARRGDVKLAHATQRARAELVRSLARYVALLPAAAQ